MRRAVPVTKRPSSEASMAITGATSGGAKPSADRRHLGEGLIGIAGIMPRGLGDPALDARRPR
jgi:hypothetical protein